MRIRIGDRVRVKKPITCNGKEFGTVVRHTTRYVSQVPSIYLVVLDVGGEAICFASELEKLPRYRGIAQGRDMVTAMKHLQEYLQ